MAEETNGNEAAEEKAGLISKILPIGIVVLVAGILAALAYGFVLAPMLGNGEEDAPDLPENPIPATVVHYDFPETQETVLVEDPDAPAPLLNYQVSMACINEATWNLIDAHKSYFIAMLGKLHRNRTKAELNMVSVQEDIRRQALLEANTLLKNLGAPEESHVIEVLHLKFVIIDL